MLKNILLACGILSSLLFAGMIFVVPMQWDAYSWNSQTLSELFAIGAPTQSIWLKLATVYSSLVTAFGIGVLYSARQNHPLRVMGGLIIAYGVLGYAWPYAPMHLRGAGFSLTDVMHLNIATISVMLMLLATGFGAAALGTGFRIYSIVSLLALLATGVLTGVNVPRIIGDLPTPRVGIWERTGIGLFLLWMVVLSLTLLQHRHRGAVHNGDTTPG